MHIAYRCAALAALVFIATLPATDTLAQGKKLYCWDEGGRRVCGDALPASAVDKSRTEFSGQSGLPQARVGRSLSEAEQAAAAAAAAQQAEAARRAAAIERNTAALSESYNTEDDLRRAFAERYELLDEGIKAAQSAIESQRRSLLEQLQAAANMELARGKVNERLAQNVQSQRRALEDALRGLARQQSARAALDGELADALARWRKARGLPETAPGTPAAQP